MAAETTIELAKLLDAATLERLQAEAERQRAPLPDLVRAAIETYLGDQDDVEYEDTPDDVIIESLRESFADALAGRTRPAREVLEEIRRELEDDADES